MKLLLDHNLSPRIGRTLQALFDQHHVVLLQDKFRVDTPDTEWIGALHAERGWTVLTKDLRIRTRPHERAAMDSASIVFFFLHGAWHGFDVNETAWRLIRLFPLMAAQSDLAERGRFLLPINAGSKLRPQRD